MRLPFLLCFAMLVAGESAHADNTQVQRGPVPDWALQSEPLAVPPDAAGAVFIRRQDTEVNLDEKGQSIYTAFRIKILHPNALQLGNLSIAWDPSAGPPIVHGIRIYRDAKAIDVLQQTSFEILRREEQLEAAKLDGNLTAILRVPDLRVGDELEFGVTIRTTDPTLGTNDAGLLTLAPEPAPGRFRLRVSWDEGFKPSLKMSPDMMAAAQHSSRAVDYRFDNPPLIAPPKDAPPRYQWQRVVEYSSFTDWAAISRRFAPLFAAASKLDAKSPLRQDVARISATYQQPLDQAAAALKLVQQDIRYVYVGLNGGNLTPATAGETWQRRYGDCKAKTALLLGLLRELGIDAQAVLVNNNGADDGFDERLPSPRMFDHVLVRATIDGKIYWLDGTLPAVATPALAPVMPYQWVLPLTEQGHALERLDWKPAERPDQVTLYEIDARAGFDQPARITSTTIMRGIEGLQQEVQLSALTPPQLLSAFRQRAIGDTWQTIEDVKWRYDQKAQASVLTISGTGTVDWDDDGDGVKSVALPGGGFSPPEKRVRSAEQDQSLPYFNRPEYDCRATTVRLPAATRQGQWSHKADIDTRMFGKAYYRAFEMRGGTLRMVRGARIEQKEVDAASARRDNGRIASFDNSMAWITYDPNGRRPVDQTGKAVPATYEIDWAADNVPCMPQSAIGNK